MILEALDITKEYRISGRKVFSALQGVSLSLGEGEVLGIVGESGSGKTTLSEIAGGLQKPTSGKVLFQGEDISLLRGDKRREYRRSVQFVFQSPRESMNPYFSIRRILSEPLSVNFPKMGRKERDKRIEETLEKVGMDPSSTLSFFPSHFSGGQSQRIAIDRKSVV